MREITMAEHMKKPSTRLWVRIMKTGNCDRRKLKRMWRLVKEGR